LHLLTRPLLSSRDMKVAMATVLLQRCGRTDDEENMLLCDGW
jgi:hypothetical protein